MKCKNCKINEGVKYSKYTTGDFCSRKCTHSFSTKNEKNKRSSVFVCDECKEKNTINKKLKENNYNYDYVINWKNNNKKIEVDYLGS